MNTKKTLIFIFFTIILTLSIVILTQKTQAQETKNLHSFTKAVCNETNFCQDHLIECENSKIKSISPITGAFIQFDKEWKDPRTQEEIKKLC